MATSRRRRAHADEAAALVPHRHVDNIDSIAWLALRLSTFGNSHLVPPRPLFADPKLHAVPCLTFLGAPGAGRRRLVEALQDNQNMSISGAVGDWRTRSTLLARGAPVKSPPMSSIGYAEGAASGRTPTLFGPGNRPAVAVRGRLPRRSACGPPAMGRRRLVHRLAARARMPLGLNVANARGNRGLRALLLAVGADGRERPRRPSTTTRRPIPSPSARRSVPPRCSSARSGRTATPPP